MGPITPSTPLEAFPGVGTRRKQLLDKLGLHTAGDLLTFYPRRYEDRTQKYSIAAAPIGVPVCVEAMIAQIPSLSFLRRGLDLVKARGVDDTGAVELTFFNQPYVKNQLRPGESYIFYGKIDLSGGKRTMTNPIFEGEDHQKWTGRILPRYPLTQGLTNNMMLSLVDAALEPCLEFLPETLPETLRREQGLVDRKTACKNVHFPSSWETLEAGKNRMAFEELFYLTLGLGLLKCRRNSEVGVALAAGSPEEYRHLLPFALTGAQRRVIEELSADLSKAVPMNRLCQGDVGSGKTAVAAFALYRAARSGGQSAMMAPTELLAQQHFATLQALLAPAGISVALLTGSMTATEKRAIRQQLSRGEIQVVVGTHALLSKGVDFQNLALVVVDEQHRFGVEQRSALSAKGVHPHVLVLSATPIPRTLALILYGDLDVSILDELPPGRQTVESYLVSESYHQRLYAFMDQQVELGRQVYVVCPAVEDPDELDETAPTLKSVKTYAEFLANQIFPHRTLAFVHGKLKPKEKEEVMSRFAKNEIQILVSTTVIEVGVDVPNASLMVVENADRFGLSQLHQLRGRVGRGVHQSYCVLVSNSTNPDTRKRLKALCSTTDGFQIAEEDLKQRGPGDFFGSRQSGLPEIQSASLSFDTRLLAQAQSAATRLLEEDPDLSQPEHQVFLRRVRQLFAENPDIFN